MPASQRITGPYLDVLEYLLIMFGEGRDDVHGWEIMKQISRSGPTVYNVLDRLEDNELVTARWEEPPPDAKRPRRRYYMLTPNGVVEARQLLSERRPARAAILRILPGLSVLGWLLGGAR